jgi:hypothetical protein
MSDGLRGYDRSQSSFGGTPLAQIQGVSRDTADALMRAGIHDAEHLIALAGIPELKRPLSMQIDGSEADLETLLDIVQAALPPMMAAAAAAPAQTRFALGALEPTPAIAAEIAAATVDLPAAAAPLPPNISHAAVMPPIRNQGGRGTCVAFAMTALHEFHRAAAGGTDDLSEQFLYHLTKLVDGAPNVCGTWNVKAAQILQSIGECREVIWGYNGVQPCNNNGVEPADARQDAANFRLDTLILPRNDVTAMKAALAGGALVAFSVPVYGSIYQAYTQQTGLINLPLPGERSIGGHAMCMIGYQDNPAAPGGGFFVIRNSWDIAWGQQCPYGAGNGTISYKYIADYCWEAVTTAATRTIPQPRPPRPATDIQGETGARPSITIEARGRYDIIIR